MALLQVNPTRMALMNLKRRAKSAKRGHKLLKDKQDGLMQQFMSIIRKSKTLRVKVEQELGSAFKSFLMASMWLSDVQLKNVLSSPEAKLRLNVQTKNVMSVRIPFFEIKKTGNMKNYGYAGTNALLDKSIDAFDKLFETLVELAQIEKQAQSMAIELETTRRRVNALEYKMIPDMTETIKYITMKLDEMERASIISTMKIKSELEKQASGVR